MEGWHKVSRLPLFTSFVEWRALAAVWQTGKQANVSAADYIDQLKARRCFGAELSQSIAPSRRVEADLAA
jgi:hypothetical protein